MMMKDFRGWERCFRERKKNMKHFFLLIMENIENDIYGDKNRDVFNFVLIYSRKYGLPLIIFF